jgi:WD40 repeat protein/serine/threonine protein kinase
MSAPATVEEFLELGHKTGVLDQKTLNAFLARQRESNAIPQTPNKLARLMVSDGLLTQFQADKLLEGKWQRFTIGEKFKVLDRLGGGSKGTVYLCEHSLMRRRVALKVLPPAKTADPDTLGRFREAAREIAHLHHPNLVETLDIDQAGQLHFLVLAYVDGTSLNKIIQAHGPMNPTRAAHYIAQAAAGLEYAHTAGLVHRNIKPSNLLLDRSGTVKILDLGVGSFFEDPKAGTAFGKSPYQAPEIEPNFADADIRADIYSLGVTFCYLLTGTTPSPQDKNPVLNNAPSSRTMQGPVRVPKELSAIVIRMMARAPEDRFQTPAEVVAALAPWTATPIAPPPAAEMTRPNPVTGGSDSTAVMAAPQTTIMRTGMSSMQMKSTPRPSFAHRCWQRLRGATKTRNGRIGLATAAAIVLILAASTLYAFTDRGTVTIETTDADVSVTIKGNGRDVVLNAAQMNQPISLRSGQYQIRPGNGMAAMKLSLESFTLERGGQVTIHAGWVRPTGKQVSTTPNGQLPADQNQPPDETYPLVMVKGETRRFLGHTDQVTSVALSADGKQALTASADASVRLWDVASGQEVRSFIGHQGPVWAVVFCTDGKQALTGGADKTVRLWDLASGKELRCLTGHDGPVRGVAMSQDGKRLVSGSEDGTARLWSVESGRELFRMDGHKATVRGVDFAPDGLQLLTAGFDKTVRLWDALNGQELRKFQGHTDKVTCVVFSADGRRALSGGCDKTVRLWDVANGQEIRHVGGHDDEVWSVAFSANGRQALSGGGKLSATGPPNDCTVRLWDLGSGRLLRTFEGHAEAVQGVALAPDERSLLTGSVDKTVRLWNFSTDAPALTVGLVGYWKCDESEGTVAADASGNGQTGKWEGQPGWAKGIVGGALACDGIKSHVTVADNPRLRFTKNQSYSVAAWVCVTEMPPWPKWSGIVTKSRDRGQWYGLWISPNNRWAFNSIGDTRENGELEGSLVTTGWHHVIGIQDAATNQCAIYIDGEEVSSRPMPARDGDGPGDLWIGAANFDKEAFHGKVDEVRIYNRALTAQEILSLCNNHN